MNFLNGIHIAECFEIINTMNYAKKCQKISRAIYSRCIKSIPIASAKITDRVDSLRIRIMNIKWELEKDNLSGDHAFAHQKIYEQLINNNSELLTYLNVPDNEIFKIKIYDAVKYMR